MYRSCTDVFRKYKNNVRLKCVKRSQIIWRLIKSIDAIERLSELFLGNVFPYWAHMFKKIIYTLSIQGKFIAMNFDLCMYSVFITNSPTALIKRSWKQIVAMAISMIALLFSVGVVTFVNPFCPQIHLLHLQHQKCQNH